jgi:glutaminyl-peptide cyclotransferase
MGGCCVMGRLLLALLLTVVAAADAGPRFDGRAAMRHVERLVAFGPRPAGSPALARARDYIMGELRRAGVESRLQRFEAATPDGPLPMANVIGMIPGRRAELIVLAGHYDTKFFRDFRFVGANDGGSSAGLLLELARTARHASREFSLWVVFFDGEEARRDWTPTDSLYGSRHLVAELTRTGELARVRAVIVVDMIGDRQLNIRREAASTGWLTDLVWAAARRLGHGAAFLGDVLPVEDDHYPFLRAQVPATLLIDFDYPAWHTADDTLARVSPRSLQIVGDVVLESLPALEAALLRTAPGGRS